jgi:hypothetical protein
VVTSQDYILRGIICKSTLAIDDVRGESAKKLGFSSLPDLYGNFCELDKTINRDMVEGCGRRYYLGLTRQKLPFDRVHSVKDYTLYRIMTNEWE